MPNSLKIYVVGGLCAVAQFATFPSSVRADVALEFGSSAFRVDRETTFGWSFTLTSSVLVTNLGYFDFTADGLDDAHPVAIWSSAGGDRWPSPLSLPGLGPLCLPTFATSPSLQCFSPPARTRSEATPPLSPTALVSSPARLLRLGLLQWIEKRAGRRAHVSFGRHPGISEWLLRSQL